MPCRDTVVRRTFVFCQQAIENLKRGMSLNNWISQRHRSGGSHKASRVLKCSRILPVLCVLLGSLLAGGCSLLPGWQLDIDDNAAWYGESDSGYADDDAAPKQYHPIVRQITPRLIRRMRQEHQARLAKPGTLVDVPRQAKQGAYRVGSGDLLAIIVYRHESLTNPAGTTESVASSGRLVDEDGEIFVPFIGEVEVAGHTLDQIRKVITKGLSRVIRKPQVDVKVLRYRSKKVYITGDISQPCTVPIRDIPLTVVAAMEACQKRSSGNSSAQGISTVKLVRNGHIYPLNLARLYRQGGDPVVLEDGDRLIVDDSFSHVFVIGAFSEQGAIPYTAGGLTLADAIAAVDGINVKTADASSIYVIRGVVEKHAGGQSGLAFAVQPHVYHLDASSAGALILADQFRLRPRDVVYVAPAPFVNFNRALSQITPTLNVLFRSAVIYDNVTSN